MKTLHWRGKTLKNSKELGTLWQFSMALWLQTLSVFRSVEELNGGRQFRVIHQQSLTWTTQNQYTVTALSVALREDYLRAIIPIHRKPLRVSTTTCSDWIPSDYETMKRVKNWADLKKHFARECSFGEATIWRLSQSFKGRWNSDSESL